MVTRHLHGLERLEYGLSLPVEWAGRFASWCGLALVFVVAGNVFARYLFNVGSVGIQELEWHLVSPIALIGMSYAMRKGEHVRVDFLYDQMSDSVKQIVDLFTAVLMAAFSIIIVVLSMTYIEQSFSLMEGSPDPGGLPYRWVLKAFIPLGFGLLALQSVSQALSVVLHFGHAVVSKREARRQHIEHSTHVPG